MKTVTLSILAVLALGADLGCAGAPPISVKAPGGVTVSTEVPAVAAATPVVVAVPAGPPAKVVLPGLPLLGTQIDVLGNIEFDTNQATIRNTPATMGVLNVLLQAGKSYTAITRLRVEGHTDDDGDAASNQALSERRATAVTQWLIERGIEPRRLVAVGCGPRVPLLPNVSPENKAKNRRTEFHIEEFEGRPVEGATAACTPNPFRRALP